ncbi:heterokaryon incompatibility protein-domain-containing protein [Phyllosticta capitalensis]|uniref:Heterokaryon incompatibility protein-domain-containing protein n=1 Tax=Phyllosticta capitalensis TaxID=121624 RepID=A0ABR1YX43_9PEZI
MESTDNPTWRPNPQPNIPLIDLSHMLDEKGATIKKSLSNKVCRVCEWDGRSKFFFVGPWNTSRESLQEEASRCCCCKARLLVLNEIVEHERLVPEATDDFYAVDDGENRNQEAYLCRWSASETKPYRSVGYDVFVPSEAPSSPIDDVMPRRNTAQQATAPEDSMGQSIAWAQDQIQNCSRRHDLCDDILANPTRLIDVAPDETGLGVKLRDYNSLSSGAPHEYVALSYCWGGHEPKCMTTHETIQRNMDYISWDLLPQTFRDAVIFTRGLGLKYLWIDSICIIQRDENDWCKEAGRMYSVYRGAKVTLAALFGNESTTGLRNTTMKNESRIVANLQFGKSIIPLCVRRHHYLWKGSGWDGNPFDYLGLLTRAWTYQERFVSPRVLFFAEGEVAYQCACEVKCECGSATRSWMEAPHEEFRQRMWYLPATQLKIRLQAKESFQSSEKTESCQSISDIQYMWRRHIVPDYSRLNITKPRDRLAALGAIAEQFQHARQGSQYLAGLWSDSLFDDLLWRINPYPDEALLGRPNPHINDVNKSLPYKREFSRPFNLPTWSWASLQCRVNYHLRASTTPLAQTVMAQCVYAKDNHFGFLEHSTLVLRSKILFCILREDKKLYKPGFDSKTLGKDLAALAIDSEQACFMDGSQAQVYIFQVLHNTWGVDFCLILRLEDGHANPRIFSRLGMMAYKTSSDDRVGDADLLFKRAFDEEGEMEEIEIC